MTRGQTAPSLSYLPWKGLRLSSSSLGRTGPPLGPARPREGAETDLNPHPLHCDWAYKPGGEGGDGGGSTGRGGGEQKRRREENSRDVNGGKKQKEERKSDANGGK